MTIPLAHTGHWFHAVLYVAPIVLIALGLWWSGRQDRGPAESDPERDAPSPERIP